MRSCRPLMLADPLPELPEGFEALVVRAELLHEGNAVVGEPEIERRLGVLFMIEPDERLRRLARSFAATLCTARSEFVTDIAALARAAAKWPNHVEQLDAYLALVVAAPAFSAERLTLIESVLDVLGAVHLALPPLHVCVAEDTSLWGPLQAFGFVQADAGQLADGALAAFEATCALMEPIFWAPNDDEDVRACFGTAEKPNRLNPGARGGPQWLAAK